MAEPVPVNINGLGTVLYAACVAGGGGLWDCSPLGEFVDFLSSLFSGVPKMLATEQAVARLSQSKLWQFQALARALNIWVKNGVPLSTSNPAQRAQLTAWIHGTLYNSGLGLKVLPNGYDEFAVVDKVLWRVFASEYAYSGRALDAVVASFQRVNALRPSLSAPQPTPAPVPAPRAVPAPQPTIAPTIVPVLHVVPSAGTVATPAPQPTLAPVPAPSFCAQHPDWCAAYQRAAGVLERLAPQPVASALKKVWDFTIVHQTAYAVGKLALCVALLATEKWAAFEECASALPLLVISDEVLTYWREITAWVASELEPKPRQRIPDPPVPRLVPNATAPTRLLNPTLQKPGRPFVMSQDCGCGAQTLEEEII